MKLLDGTELADYIKERQAKQVRNLKQSWNIHPKLAIVQTVDAPVINTYVRMKQLYGKDLSIEVEVYKPTANDAPNLIKRLNQDETVHGIIVQLPVAEDIDIDALLNSVSIDKDVDGLAENSRYTAATAQAIDWLLNGYNVELKNQRVAIVGNGRLVGSPLAKLWRDSGYDVSVFDEHSKNVAKSLRRYHIIISATGVPGLIQSDSLQPGAVVVDAATTAEHGKIVGDVDESVRQRSDITITPEKGGVGPLTVVSLFDNVIRSARYVAEASKSVVSL